MRVLFIDIDTLNPSHMGCYGYHRDTSPNIDAIARESVRFNNYYCSDAPCLPSRAALVSGMFGIHNGAVGHGGTGADKRINSACRGFRNDDDENNLFNIFRKKNMHTVSISSFAERHSAWWFNAGFKEMYNVGDKGYESGETVLPIALNWLQDNEIKDNWFMHFHIWDPHSPIRVPEEFGKPFEDEPIDNWYTEELLEKHKSMIGPHSLQELSMYSDDVNEKYPRQLGKVNSLSDLKQVVDEYDTGILYADYIIGEIIASLKEQGIYEDTAIIITSDHGENMGELGIYQEHGTADEATCRLPMIVKWPGSQENIVIEGLKYHIDLLPTLAELLNVEPYYKWDGCSYKEALFKGEDKGYDYLVMSQMAHVIQRSVRFEEYLYIRTYHCGFHLFDDEMLFNVVNDPHEAIDIKEDYPTKVREARNKLLEWTDGMMNSSEYSTDPMKYVLGEGGPYHAKVSIHLEKYLEHLIRTGREEGAFKLKEKYR